MFREEFGGAIFLSLSLLGLTLAVGFVVLRFIQARGKKKLEQRVPTRAGNQIERELESEIAAVRAKRAHDGVHTEAGGEALGLSAEELERQAEIRRLAEGNKP